MPLLPTHRFIGRFTGRFTIVALGLLILVGCASFPGKQLPIHTYDELAPVEPRPSIDYDAKFLALGMENAAGVRVFQEEIEKVFGNSHVFSKFGSGIGAEKYHLSLMLRNEGNIGLAMLSGFISGLTFLVIPAYAEDEYVLLVDVKSGDQAIKHYEYRDSMYSWIELFLIVLTPTHWPPTVAKEVIDNMLLNVLHDLQKDKILTGPPTGPAGSG